MSDTNDPAAPPQAIDPIIERWKKLAREEGYEIDVGSQLRGTAESIQSIGTLRRTYFPSGLIVPKRFELLREQIKKNVLQWREINGQHLLVRLDVDIVIGHIKPVGMFGIF